MTQTVINVGTTVNDGTGDTLRGAFANTNNNFTEVYAIATYGSNTVNTVYAIANLSYAIATYGSNTVNTVYAIANTANTKATVQGPYDTDFEAGVNGVAIGGLYYKPQGNVHIRLA